MGGKRRGKRGPLRMRVGLTYIRKANAPYSLGYQHPVCSDCIALWGISFLLPDAICQAEKSYTLLRAHVDQCLQVKENRNGVDGSDVLPGATSALVRRLKEGTPTLLPLAQQPLGQKVCTSLSLVEYGARGIVTPESQGWAVFNYFSIPMTKHHDQRNL